VTTLSPGAALGAFLALFVLFGPGAPVAQLLGLGNADSKDPIEIYADEGIEWQQESQVAIAHGNAKAIQGEVAVHADTLTAYYRKREDGATEIWRIDAEGNVRVVSPNETATGKKGVYDIDNGILVLSENVRLKTVSHVITARDNLEYWEKKQLAVARGNALMVENGKRLSADVLSAHLDKEPSGKTKISRIDAHGNVHISTPSEIIRGNRGVYDLETGIATITGAVRITRGDTQLSGERAVVDTRTGVSHLLSTPGKKGGRVHGLIPQGPLKSRNRQPDGSEPQNPGKL
jgi:lipopolysaccharide export system protein LptA